MKQLCYVVILGLLIGSCAKEHKPNYQFFPNMYESVGYETYQDVPFFANGSQAQEPVLGSVSRGWLPYEHENTSEGYQKSKTQNINPLEASEEHLNSGKALFNIYCAICHGEKGDGQGNLVKREKFLGVPSYKDRDITQGSIYHVIYYGLNSMGSHAGQLNSKERWQVAMYVESLRNELIK